MERSEFIAESRKNADLLLTSHTDVVSPERKEYEKVDVLLGAEFNLVKVVKD